MGENYVVQFHENEKITGFLEELNIAFWPCTHYHAHVLSFLFCLGNNRLLLYPFWLSTMTTCIRWKLCKKRHLSTVTGRHIAIVTPYVYSYASLYGNKFGENKIEHFCFNRQAPKLISCHYYPPYGVTLACIFCVYVHTVVWKIFALKIFVCKMSVWRNFCTLQ